MSKAWWVGGQRRIYGSVWTYHSTWKTMMYRAYWWWLRDITSWKHSSRLFYLNGISLTVCFDTLHTPVGTWKQIILKIQLFIANISAEKIRATWVAWITHISVPTNKHISNLAPEERWQSRVPPHLSWKCSLGHQVEYVWALIPSEFSYIWLSYC